MSKHLSRMTMTAVCLAGLLAPFEAVEAAEDGVDYEAGLSRQDRKQFRKIRRDMLSPKLKGDKMPKPKPAELWYGIVFQDSNVKGVMLPRLVNLKFTWTYQFAHVQGVDAAARRVFDYLKATPAFHERDCSTLYFATEEDAAAYVMQRKLTVAVAGALLP